MFRQQESDSSDEDVCFGKYTIKEAKKDLQKYIPRKINRRHTSICKLSDSQINTTQDISVLANHFEEKNNISSDTNKKWSLEYLTANESMSTDRLSQNSQFLEKLTKVINEPVSEASSYNTAFDRTNVFDNTSNQCDDTFLARFKNQPTFTLDNVHHTLVENTVLSAEDSFDETCNYEDKNNKSCSPEEINDSIISIDDGSLSEQNSAYELVTNENLYVFRSPEAVNVEYFGSESNISTKNKLIDHANSLYEGSFDLQLENKNYYLLHDESKASKTSFDFKSLSISDSDAEPTDYSCNIQLKDISENLSNSRDSSENTSFEDLQKFERVIFDHAQLSKISEKTEFTSCVEDRSSIKQQNNSGVLSTDSLSCSKKFIDSDNQIKYIQEIKRSTTLDVDGISFSSNSEVSKISGISDVFQLSKNSEIHDHLEVTKSSEESVVSPIQAPDIHLEQFNDSYQFDDTLEEMNRLLEQGVDYEMPEVTHSKTTPLKEPFMSNNIISGSFMNTSSNSAGLENRTPKTKILSSRSVEKCKEFYSAGKIKSSVESEGSTVGVKSRYQQELTCKLPSASARSLFTKKTKNFVVEGDFKVPTKPVKKLPTPSKLPKPLKGVVSPVGVYIKHSPKYCPMIRVPQSTGNSHIKMSKLVRPDSTTIKENIPCASNQEIPKVIYRPAKNREIKEETEVILPGSIKKLIKEQVVTKHEQRIQDDECNQSIERRLLESDLSLNLSHNSQDISILTNKQPFNIRRF